MKRFLSAGSGEPVTTGGGGDPKGPRVTHRDRARDYAGAGLPGERRARKRAPHVIAAGAEQAADDRHGKQPCNGRLAPEHKARTSPSGVRIRARNPTPRRTRQLVPSTMPLGRSPSTEGAASSNAGLSVFGSPTRVISHLPGLRCERSYRSPPQRGQPARGPAKPPQARHGPWLRFARRSRRCRRPGRRAP